MGKVYNHIWLSFISTAFLSLSTSVKSYKTEKAKYSALIVSRYPILKLTRNRWSFPAVDSAGFCSLAPLSDFTAPLR